MGIARTGAVALLGVEGHRVEVEAHVRGGRGSLNLVGLPDPALREARDRIRAAIINSGEYFPDGHITVSLSPASLPKRGSGFDLGIATAVLAANGQVPLDDIRGAVLIAELGLDGSARAVPGVLPAVLACRAAGVATVVVARGNATEAQQVPGMRVVAVSTLADLIARLRGEIREDTASTGTTDSIGCGAEGRAGCAPAPPAPSASASAATRVDLADVLGQELARNAMEIAAAGGHNVFLLGSPGAGKSLLAERLPTILPSLTTAESLEVSAIHSVAGALAPERPLVTEPPFRAPHHSATRAAVVGGGTTVLQPGAASLAHRGVLLMDEAPEFDSGILDALRQPLETGEIVVSRAAATARFPARFQLVLAANPCPCSQPGHLCTCPATVRRRYLARLSGPLLDRVDMKIEVVPATRAELLGSPAAAESSATVADRVAQARERAAERLRDTPWCVNAAVPGSELRRRFPLPGQATGVLSRALERGTISARGVDRITRVAWTVADLARRPHPTAEEVGFALALWSGTAR
ncbi:YifB family Mg chelatase-like AAA ATPase [Lipingzhangella sp. LS1_29]|uniref:YifB family Mg chelatase-like AAA ATPase n=1 Tax=Lipingzhangella rawalii TaxID=2055835 RepID=A0ABU2H5P8_9ACTN|nr:YifB family Mg chelatase-like AAA ATPase [Lipingzhangella rawalii]MDS1270623.1 YifB family Mg chelatase-like AAA ATPase [Lipingzhangella rawalii]